MRNKALVVAKLRIAFQAEAGLIFRPWATIIRFRYFGQSRMRRS